MNLDKTIFTNNFKRITTILGVILGCNVFLYLLTPPKQELLEEAFILVLSVQTALNTVVALLILLLFFIYLKFVRNKPFKKMFITFVCMALFSGVLAAPYYDMPKRIKNRTVILAHLGSKNDQHHLAVMYHMAAIMNDDKGTLDKKVYWKARAEQK
jgi:hypothetical protein